LVGLKGRNTSLLWVQNRDHTWHKVALFRTPVKKQPESILQINNWPNGQYKVVFWDTYKGKQISTSNIAVENQKLQLQLPAIEKDIAIRIDRIVEDR
ncbi:MAG TPA: hypothetical protein PKV43_03590, partial [Armatimonadota bacterium]|nr:hypothetical protein [Armatimonadota bacterium]